MGWWRTVSYKSRGAHQGGPEGTAAIPRQAAIQALAESFKTGCEKLGLTPTVDLKNPEVGHAPLKLTVLQQLYLVAFGLHVCMHASVRVCVRVRVHERVHWYAVWMGGVGM